MKVLDNFNEDHQHFVVECLKQRIPHKRIAKAFREKYPDFSPELDDETYIQAFTRRTLDYVKNTDRKWAAIIAEGRQIHDAREQDTLLLPHSHYRTGRREALQEKLEDLTQRIDSSDIEAKDKFRFEFDAIKVELQILNDYEKSDRAEHIKVGESDDDDGYPTEDDFDYETSVA